MIHCGTNNPPFATVTGSGAVGRRAAGFTLTEMLVVIGIVVIVALLAIPAFRAMSGSRSTESALNQISSFLARARTEALGLEEPRGVLFYRDLDTRRIGMLLVRPSNTQAPWELDMVPDREPMLLPEGVGVQFIDDYTPVSGPRDTDGYIGFNTRVLNTADTNAFAVPYGGVILFDKQGRVSADQIAFRIRYPAAAGVARRVSELGRFLYNNPTLPVMPMPEVVTPAPAAEAKLGFVVFESEPFNEQFGGGRTAPDTDRDTQVSGNGTMGAANGPFAGTAASPREREEEVWLDENATPILINRYNGTLMRGE